MDNSTLLILITLLPLIGMAVILMLPKSAIGPIRWTALGVTVVQIIVSSVLWAAFDPAKGGINDAGSFQFITKATWLDLQSGFLGNVHIDFFFNITVFI